MTLPPKPALRPANPRFSSGPCTKRPGWTPEALNGALLGRNHRQPETKARIEAALLKTRDLLELPDDYRVALVPASDTGAVEMALWSLLGPRGVDVLAWEAFSRDWVTDILDELRLTDVRPLLAAYGSLPDLSEVDFDRDVVFAWNGTTSGVRVPNADWIAADRKGLTICDATSAVFAQDLDWRKLDATTYSWQKVLGGEAQHGMLILSPRAIERLESYAPPWPLPKLFRLTKNGKVMDDLFEGSTINTPSMLCLEDYMDALAFVESVGGLKGTMARADANAAVIADWVAKTPWVEFMARAPETRSNTSVCLRIADSEIAALPPEARDAFPRSMAARLSREDVAKDIASYRDAPAGLRIWTGATVERSDVEALMPWLDWAFACEKAALAKAA
ncbi:phosphoserine aminotransferase [Methyloceanibacter superfactus]|uniref:phosphoserine transaminase n=1 Tax=Methyloceanibacter superfactus TaxID=1774969 RepID=A0A1E3VT69_9HYPH|nr:phosphoserine transaminase [Methyloceanibacter superfactus]ODR96740.1 phosphoserine aminotransferase [Methyloceanibacter superfactus]